MLRGVGHTGLRRAVACFSWPLAGSYPFPIEAATQLKQKVIYLLSRLANPSSP